MTSAEGMVTVSNTGQDKLTDLFLLQIRGEKGQLTQLSQLAPGARQELGKLVDEGATPARSRESVRSEISQQMEAALVAAGLFPREATAMVKTWSDLWFGEDGVRVLYLLPRAWTDQILPITVTPAPRELVRVMVGRAEIIPPATQRALTRLQTKAGAKDPVAEFELKRFERALGRFYPAAYQLAQNN
jgi:hypothetical protein